MDVYVNPSVFWHPQAARFPGTSISFLDAMRQEFSLKSLNEEQAQAIWILHELGHISGSFASDMGNLVLSQTYTRQVIERCFPWLL